jgi:hypothetical protein
VRSADVLRPVAAPHCRYTPDASLSTTDYYASAREAVDGLNLYASKVQRALPPPVASLPEVDAMNASVRKFVAASKEVPVTVCPTSCLNVGSLYDTLRLPTSCVCSDANMMDVADQAVSTWKVGWRGPASWLECAGAAGRACDTSCACVRTALTPTSFVCPCAVQMLVHVLAALALMGLGCLWLIMNLAAEHAHAVRDWRELPGRSPTTLTRVSQQKAVRGGLA